MKRYGIVASRFNREITERLVEGALDFFRARRVRSSRADLVWVPGAFELPSAALRLARSGRYAGVVAVGCILEGETAHYRYLSAAALSGLLMAGLLSGVPVGCGVITARSWRAALARSQKRGVNRGREAAEATWDMAHGAR